MTHSPIDDAALDALATGTLQALAALVTNPDIAARLEAMRVGDTNKRNVQAAASAHLLRALGEEREAVLTMAIQELHFGEVYTTLPSRIVTRNVLRTVLDAGETLAEVLCVSPAFRELHMNRLSEALARARIALKNKQKRVTKL